MNQTHQVLISEARLNSEVAMMQLYDMYCQAMYTVACRYLNSEDAKDAMQDSFLKAFKKLDSYQPEFTFGAWLKKIVINTCLDKLKLKQLNIVDSEIEHLSLTTDDNWDFDVAISKQTILNAIEQLKPKHKIVVKLYLIEGYDHEEISDILSIPVKTSRTHLRRGKLQLQDLLKTMYNEARY